MEILPTTEGLVLSVKTLKCNKHVASFPTNEPGHVLAISELSFFPGSNSNFVHAYHGIYPAPPKFIAKLK